MNTRAYMLLGVQRRTVANQAMSLNFTVSAKGMEHERMMIHRVALNASSSHGDESPSLGHAEYVRWTALNCAGRRDPTEIEVVRFY
jgi:hypothetical protein